MSSVHSEDRGELEGVKTICIWCRPWNAGAGASRAGTPADHGLRAAPSDKCSTCTQQCLVGPPRSSGSSMSGLVEGGNRQLLMLD